MAPPIQPTKVKLNYCKLNGVDVRLHVSSISVFETMCKPYITAAITFLDQNNVISTIPMNKGLPVDFSITDGFSGRKYTANHYILQGPDDASQNRTLRSQQYTIRTAGPSYFLDRANLVQRSDANISGTDLINKIFNEYLSGDAPLVTKGGASTGFVAKSPTGFVTENLKPFTAIENIMKNMKYGGIKTGSSMFFRDQKEYVLAPLEYLFTAQDVQDTFIQKATWGSNWQDGFGPIVKAVLAAQQIDTGDGAGEMAAGQSGALNVWDAATGKELARELASSSSDLSGILGAAVGGNLRQFIRKNGGYQIAGQIDTRKIDASWAQILNIKEQKSFQAAVKQATNYLIQVPIAFHCTVGKHINAKLIPPFGDQHKGKSAYGGVMLVADLEHRCDFYSKDVQGTTTFRGVKPGVNA